MRKILLLALTIGLFSTPVTTDTPPTSVYFDKEALEPVLEMIDNAQYSIYIQMYNFTNPHKPDEQFSQVIDCLLNKIKQYPDKTLDLKILIDNQGANKPPEMQGKDYGFPEKEFEGLIKDCIKWDKSSNTMHRKVAVIDRCKVFIGSTNWTNNGFFENKEIDVLLHDTTIANKITEQFNKDWGEASNDYPLKQKEPEMPAPPDREEHYIGNKNPSSMKFHRPSCKYIHTIDENNKVPLQTREEAQERGFYPCGECKP